MVYPQFHSAEDAYAEFQRRRQLGESISLDELCDRYPELAEGIRWLHSLAIDAPASRGDDSGRDTRTGGSGEAGPAAEVWRAFDELGVRAGDSIGPYRLLDILGSGGFGTVFLAQQVEPVQREVALKLLHAGAASPEALTR